MNNIRDRKCESCGIIFQGGPRAWYCPDCRKERQRVRDAEFKRHGPVRPIGSIDHCVVCGKEYVVMGGLQKYCPGCNPDATRDVDNRQGKEYYHANKEVRNPVKNAKRRKPDAVPCARCGKLIVRNGTCKKYCDDCRVAVIKEQ